MTALPDWAINPQQLVLTEEQYEELPEEAQKLIEVIDGLVIFCRSGSPEHNIVARRLATALDSAKPSEPCTRVLTDFEMRYRNEHPKTRGFSFRRPDVFVARCLPKGQMPRTSDVLIAVEVISPGSEYMDTVDKCAEYAAEGIPVYLVVHLDDDLRVKIIQEYRLDWASGTYRCAQTHQELLVLREPFPLMVAFADLDA